MGRTVAVIWHASFAVVAGVLYFFFVLPRWPELAGDTSPTLGIMLRIVTGALIGLAALPVVFTLLRTRRPEFGTPRLALGLRIASIALQVLAGALIIGTAVSEIWLDLDSAGQWLFGFYGAAAAIALLGIFGFYLAFVAELPPPPPKPLRPSQQQRRRGRAKAKAEADADAETHGEAEPDTEPKPDAESGSESESDAEADAESDVESESQTPEDDKPDDDRAAQDEPDKGLRNRRPSGKSGTLGRRRRTRGGVAVDD